MTLQTFSREPLAPGVARTVGDAYTNDGGSITAFRRCVCCGGPVDPRRADYIVLVYDAEDPASMTQDEYLRAWPDGPLAGPSGVCHREGECAAGEGGAR